MSKTIFQVFERYQNNRAHFAQSVADLASWQSNIKCLEGTDVIELLVPLIDDKMITIRRTSAIAAGKLAEKSEVLARRILSTNMLPSLLKQIPEADVFFKRAILHFIRGIARHNEELALEVINMKALEIIVTCLEDFDTQVKENAAWALGLIGRHNKDLTMSVVDSGALNLLVLCLQQPELTLKQIVSGVLEDLSQYQPQAVMDAGALPYLVKAAENEEPKLKKCALGALSTIALGSEQLAEAVVNTGALKIAMLQPSPISARLIRNVVKHSPDLAQLAVDLGACGMLVQLLRGEDDSYCSVISDITDSASPTTTQSSPKGVSAKQLAPKSAVSLKGEKKGGKSKPQPVPETPRKFDPLPSISPSIAPAAAALGYIAAQTDQLALAVIASKAVPPLVRVLCEAARMMRNDAPPETQRDCERWAAVCAASWALGHISQHSPEHSEAVAAAGAFPILLQLWQTGAGGEEVRTRIGCALRMALQCCLHRPALEPLLHTAPSPLLECVLIQYAKILPRDPRARRLFVTTGALQRLQELPTEPGTQLQHLISVINSYFPEEIVRYYSPGFPDSLLERIDDYTPQIPELFVENHTSECTSDLNIHKISK